MIAPGLLLALIGPFGSFAAPLPMRLAYWLPTMAFGAVLGFATARIMLRAAPSLAARRVAFAGLHTVVVAGLMTFVVGGWSFVVFGPGAMRLTPALVFYVGVVTAAISFLRILPRPWGTAANRTASSGAAVQGTTRPPCVADSPPPLLRRLSPERRTAAVHALEAEDHYVRVHTSLGKELVLMRLSDAIAEMGAVEGVRAHRSWWVAKAAVARTRRENGRMTLVLADGAEAPVSRAAAAAVRAAIGPER